MKLALKNIFKQPEPLIRFVTIISKSTNGFLTEDVFGRKFIVAYNPDYKVGDNVSIQSGSIMKRIGELKKAKTINV